MSRTQVLLGTLISHHLQALREDKPLPSSPAYLPSRLLRPNTTNATKRSVLRAIGLLVHYLLLGNNAQRQPQFARFLQFAGACARP
ncbi:MAG: hypothetical protein U0Y68_25445 [Blastocatellia bacterium]